MITARVQPRDVLFLMFQELLAQAQRLPPIDGDGRQRWLDASRMLLEAVGAVEQRAAWAVELAVAFAHTMPGVPLALIARMLLEEA